MNEDQLRFLIQMLNNPGGFLASTDSAGQVAPPAGSQYQGDSLPPPANMNPVSTTTGELPPGLGGPMSSGVNTALPIGPGNYEDVAPGLPIAGPPGTPGTFGTGEVDPQTGLPAPPAAPMTDPSVIDPGDPNNNLTRGGVSMPLYPTSGDVFPGTTPGVGQFFSDAAGNIFDAAGNLISAAADAIGKFGQGFIDSLPKTAGGFGQPAGYFGTPDQLPIGYSGATATIGGSGGTGSVANTGIGIWDILASGVTPRSVSSVQAPSGGPSTGLGGGASVGIEGTGGFGNALASMIADMLRRGGRFDPAKMPDPGFNWGNTQISAPGNAAIVNPAAFGDATSSNSSIHFSPPSPK